MKNRDDALSRFGAIRHLRCGDLGGTPLTQIMRPWWARCQRCPVCSGVTPVLPTASSIASVPSTTTNPAVVATKQAALAIPKCLDFEQVRSRARQQHFGDNGGFNADIMGAASRLHGVTVLDGKRHAVEDSTSRLDAALAKAICKV